MRESETTLLHLNIIRGSSIYTEENCKIQDEFTAAPPYSVHESHVIPVSPEVLRDVAEHGSLGDTQDLRSNRQNKYAY